LFFLFQYVLFELFIDYIFIYLFNCVIFQKIFDAIYKPANHYELTSISTLIYSIFQFNIFYHFVYCLQKYKFSVYLFFIFTYRLSPRIILFYWALL